MRGEYPVAFAAELIYCLFLLQC